MAPRRDDRRDTCWGMGMSLAPTPTRPPRLAALAKLPVFFDLADRPVLVIGGGEPVVWKAELLLASGARLALVCREPHPELEELARENTRLALVRRDWREADLEGVALIVADIEEADEAAGSPRRRGHGAFP